MNYRLFIGSSSEHLDYAESVQLNLSHVKNLDVICWSQNTFRISHYPLDDLLTQLEHMSFGVFILAPDDYVKIRDDNYYCVRDNVIFEMGMFFGALGRERTFFMAPEDIHNSYHIPSDLDGINYAKKEYKADTSLEAPAVRTYEKEMRVLSLDEQQALENHLFSNLDLIAIGCLLSLYVGLRIGELSALKLSDFDFSNGTVKITKTMQRVKNFDPEIKTKTKIIINSPKSKKSVRTLPVPGFLLDIIKKRYNLVIPNAYFLTGKTSRYKEPRRVEYQFKKITDRCGLKAVNFHALRHTFATRLTENGTDVKTLSELMGHANIKTTLKYMHSSEQQKRAVMNCFTYPLSRQNLGISNREYPINQPFHAI